jgi:hypothetical protein
MAKLRVVSPFMASRSWGRRSCLSLLFSKAAPPSDRAGGWSRHLNVDAETDSPMRAGMTMVRRLQEMKLVPDTKADTGACVFMWPGRKPQTLVAESRAGTGLATAFACYRALLAP